MNELAESFGIIHRLDCLFAIPSASQEYAFEIDCCIKRQDELLTILIDVHPPFILCKCCMQKAFGELLKKKFGFPSLNMFNVYKLISEAIHLCVNDIKNYFSILLTIGDICDREFEKVSILHDKIFVDLEWLVLREKNDVKFILMKHFTDAIDYLPYLSLSSLFMAPLYLKMVQIYHMDMQMFELTYNVKKLFEKLYKFGKNIVEDFEITEAHYKQWKCMWDLGYATLLCHDGRHDNAHKYIPVLDKNDVLFGWSQQIKLMINREKLSLSCDKVDIDYIPAMNLIIRQSLKETSQVDLNTKKRTSSKKKIISKEPVHQPVKTKSSNKNVKKHLKRKAKASESSVDNTTCLSSFDTQSTISGASVPSRSHEYLPDSSSMESSASSSSIINTPFVAACVSNIIQNRVVNSISNISNLDTTENNITRNASDSTVDRIDSSSNDKKYSKIKKYYEVLEDEQEFDDPLAEENRRDPKDAIYTVKSPSELERLARESPNKYFRCALKLEGAHLGYATPLDNCGGNISRINLIGRRNCGRAMQGDEVLVELKGEKKDDHHGCVVGVLKPIIKAKYHLFLCEVSSDKATLMRPLCGTVPKISVSNKEARARQQKTLDEELPKNQEFQHRLKNGMLSNREKLRNTKNSCDLNEVCLYDVEPSKPEFSSRSKFFFKFRSFKPVNRLQSENLFLVCYLHWRQDMHYPSGFVLAPIPQSNRDFKLQTQMFARQYLLPLEYSIKGPFFKKAKEIVRSIESNKSTIGRKDMRKVLTVTIDNPTTKDMDDALSCEELKDGTFQVGVHITDVTHFIKKDSSLDKEARRRCLTFYPPYSMKADMTPNHMLPMQLSEHGLSLQESSPRFCLSVLFHLSSEGKALKEAEIEETVICSNRRLNKEDVQAVIESREPINKMNDKIKKMLFQLYKLAFCMRRKRLGPAAMVIQSDRCNSDDEFGINFEAECLVEEFMVAANCHVAKYVCEKYPNEAVLRMQSPPSQTEVNEWISKFRSLIPLSGKLRRCISQVGQPQESGDPWALALYEKIAKLIKTSIEESDYRQARKAVLSEDRHPQLMLAIFEWYKIMNNAKYVVGCSDSANTSHFDLQMKHYTHFTSPLRRYVDVVVHHFVKAGLRQEKAPFSKTDLQFIVNSINARCTQNRQYDLECRRAEFSINMREKPRQSHVVVTEVNPEDLRLTDSCIRGLGGRLQCVKHSKLSLQHKPQMLAGQAKVNLQWSKQLFILPQGFSNLNLLKALRNRSATSKNLLHLDPNRFFQFLQHSDDIRHVSRWLSDLRESVASFDESKTCNLLKTIGANIKSSVNNSSVFAVSSERQCLNQTNNSVASEDFFHDTYVTFDVEIRPGSLLPIQFSTRLRNGREEPFIQLVDFCPTFKVCVEHRDDAIGCFASTKYQKIPKQFKNIEHYRDSWLPLVQMESAAVAVVADDTFSLESVSIDWSFDKKKKTWCGIFSLPESWCQSRQIQFSNEERTEEDMTVEYVKERCFLLDHFQDYLCIRYDLGDHTWLGHAGVTIVCSIKSCRLVGCRLHQTSMFDANPPKMAVDKNISATIEVTRKFLPNTHQEVALSRIVHLQTGLASKIALFEENDVQNFDCPELEGLARFDIVTGKKEYEFYNDKGRKLRSWLPTKLTCNKNQNEAIINSIKKPLTLIWGPPGTGKTTTGVMLSYWFAWINCKRDGRELSVFSDKNKTAVQPDIEAEINDDALVQDMIAQSEELKESALLDEVKGVDLDLDEWKIVKSREEEREERDQRDQQRQVKEQEKETKEKNNEKAFIDSQKQTRRQILYCGPSNSCINLVAGYMQSKLDQQCPKIVRVFSEQVELRDYPVPGSQVCNSKLSQDVQVPEQMKNISLHILIRRREDQYGDQIRAFDALFAELIHSQKFDSDTIIEQGQKLLHKHPKFTKLLQKWRKKKNKITSISLKDVIDSYRRAVTYAKSLELQNYDIVLCTTSVSSSGVLQSSCRFEQIIIDEAGMCTEPETLVPLVYQPSLFDDAVKKSSASSFCKNVVLIGDHKQLRPIIQCQAAADLGLEKSLFERFCTKAIMLNEQYRMHPSICEFPSVHFYERQLITKPSPTWTGLGREDIRRNCWPRWNGINARDIIPNGEFEGKTIAMDFVFGKYGKIREEGVNILAGYWPGVRHETPYLCLPGAKPCHEEERVVFVHVEGVEEILYVSSSEGHEQSRGNAIEADEVVRIFCALRNLYKPPRLAYKGLAVLSQYRLQVNRIREKLAKEIGFTTVEPQVSTVISAQGSEFDYVILSLVRSMPKYNIDPRPTPGWERKYLGFITDENQINVALTRARRGLIIVGNKHLLRVYPMWEKLISDLEKRKCVVEKGVFPSKSPVRKVLTDTEIQKKRSSARWNDWKNANHVHNENFKHEINRQNQTSRVVFETVNIPDADFPSLK